MKTSTKYVTEAVLAQLIETGAILTVYILEDGDGRFHVVARSSNSTDHRLEKKRGGERIFKTVDTAAQLVRSMGVTKIRLHMNEFVSDWFYPDSSDNQLRAC